MPCATVHTCSCNCEESKRLAALEKDQVAGGGGGWVAAETEDRRVNEQQAAIEGYQAYAKGGAKEHDAILNQMAELEQESFSTNLESLAEEDLIPGTWNTPNPGAQDGSKQAKPKAQPEINLLDDW